MKNIDIYNGALKILAERCEEGANDDYEERAPYIIAAFCCEAADLDSRYRKANALPGASQSSNVYLPLDGTFPCSGRFNTAACIYLAAMLVMDSDSDLSDRLYDKYSDIMSAISMELPASIEKISDRYNYD